MRSLIIIFIAVIVLAGCAVPQSYPPSDSTQMGGGITRFVDSEASVVCWAYTGGYGVALSCMPLYETALEVE